MRQIRPFVVERKGARRSKTKPTDIWGGVVLDVGGDEATAPASPADRPGEPDHACAVPQSAIVPRRILMALEPATPADDAKASGSRKRRADRAKDDHPKAPEIPVEPVSIVSGSAVMMPPPAEVDAVEVKVNAPRSAKLRRKEFAPGERWMRRLRRLVR